MWFLLEQTLSEGRYSKNSPQGLNALARNALRWIQGCLPQLRATPELGKPAPRNPAAMLKPSMGTWVIGVVFGKVVVIVLIP